MSRNANTKYENHTSQILRQKLKLFHVMAKVKVFQKKVKLHGQGHYAKHYGIIKKFYNKQYTSVMYEIPIESYGQNKTFSNAIQRSRSQGQ